MILGRELPAWKQIAGKIDTTKKPFMEDEGSYLFAESCQSLAAIMRAVRAVRKKENITLWMPDYFCNQTLACFREEWIRVEYYPVGEELEPDWKVIRAEAKRIKEESTPNSEPVNHLPDIFLFVHYFGVAHDISAARDFCNNNSVILIEDCAHCLYPHPLGQIGQKGDFVIYSQHKQLPISDGAVLRCNPGASKADMKDEVAAVIDEIDRIYKDAKKRPDMSNWYAKKAVQKLAPFIHRGLTYTLKTHFSDEKERDYPIERISDKSYSILAGYSYEDYKRIAYIRRDNLRIMNEAIKRRIPSIVILNEPNDLETPYMGVYSLKNLPEDEKENAVKRLLDEDFTVLYWPDLPYELSQEAERKVSKEAREDEAAESGFNDHSRAYEMSRDIFVIPAIHQDVTPQQLVKKFLLDGADDTKAVVEAGPVSILHKKNGAELAVKKARLHLAWKTEKTDHRDISVADGDYAISRAELSPSPEKSSEESSVRDIWNYIYEHAETTNIPQDYVYGGAKEKTEGWGLKRAVVLNEADEPVGVLQVLIKKIKGIPVAARVNRGPVLIGEYDCVENHIAVMKELRKTIKSPMPIAWAPFVVWTPENLIALTEAGYRCTDPYSYPSGYLDLSKSGEELLKDMQPFWRKHLKQAKKQVTIQINRYSASEVRALYKKFLEMKEIPGIPDAMVEYLFKYMEADASSNVRLSPTPKKSSGESPTFDEVDSVRKAQQGFSTGEAGGVSSDDFSGGGEALPASPTDDYRVLEVLTAHNLNGNMIAYKVLYRHGNTGTSFIAWNTDEGRDKQARTYLISESALRLKELGCKFYDLGGIDDITTEAVAKFKRGTGDTDYRLLGEFINVI